jgi:guanylate kinase
LSKLLGNLKQGLAFVVSAPAGTGKTTLVQMLTHAFPMVTHSISCTTREPREKEVSGGHYHFLKKEDFKKKILSNEFLEYVELYGNYYGTSKETVTEQLKCGKHVILTIDTQGALQLKGKFAATYIFISPPSLEVLRKRLIQRRTETAELIEKRLAWASKEMQAASLYDYNIVNDDLNIAYQALLSIIVAEEHRVCNRIEQMPYGLK